LKNDHIIAVCERCHGIWRVDIPDADYQQMEGHCPECSPESEVAERPLVFGTLTDDIELDPLESKWVAWK